MNIKDKVQIYMVVVTITTTHTHTHTHTETDVTYFVDVSSSKSHGAVGHIPARVDLFERAHDERMSEGAEARNPD